MISKLKEWLFRGVILKKVVGKLVKHAVTMLAGLLAAKPILADAGVTIDWKQFETWATLMLGGPGWGGVELY